MLFRSQWGALGYWAKRFYQMFSPHCKKYVGGIAAARTVVTNGRTGGFAFLEERGGLDLSVEALILKREWSHLFSDAVRALARKKLATKAK